VVNAAPTIKITADKILELNAQNIGESFKFSQSTIFRQGRLKREYYLNVRGLDQEQIVVLVDGMPLNQPYDGVLDLQNIMTADIAEASLIKGSASPIYGGQGIAGVLNIITKKSADKNGHINFQYGTANSKKIDFNLSKKINKFNFFIAGNYNTADYQKLSENYTIRNLFGDTQTHYIDDKKLNNTDYIKRSFSFKTIYDLSNKSVVGFTTEYYNNDLGVAPHFVTNISTCTEQFRKWRWTNWERATYNIIYKYEDDGFGLKTRIFLDNFDNTLDHKTNYLGDTYLSAVSMYDDRLMGANIALSKKFEKLNTELSLNYKEDKHSEQGKVTEPWLTFKSRAYSFGNLNTIDFDSLKLQLGASIDIFDKVSAQELISNNAVDTITGKSVETFNPYFSTMYNFDNSNHMSFSYARKVKFPTLKNLYSRGVDGAQSPGNPNLKAEQSDNLNLLLEHLIKEGKLSLGIFYYDIDNHIIFNNNTGTYIQFDARIYGIELSGLKKINKFSVDGSITLMKARDDSNKLSSADIEYRPKVQANAGLSYLDNGYKINLNNKY
ncbi:MAG TPA: TonB-dependent receptor, partial [bacterium]|nr:TonB-dependent receptor [bacterium]